MSGAHYHVQFAEIERSFRRCREDFERISPATTTLSLGRQRGSGWRVTLMEGGRPSRDISPRLAAPKMVEWLNGFEEALTLVRRFVG